MLVVAQRPLDRCALLALPLSRYGGYLVGHLRSLCCLRRHLRMRRHRLSASTAILLPRLGFGDCEFFLYYFFLFPITVSAFLCVYVLLGAALVSHTVNLFTQNVTRSYI